MLTDSTNSSNSSTNNLDSTPVTTKKRSWVWLSNYATKLNTNSPKCYLCSSSNLINLYNGSTNGVSKHLLNKHGITEKSKGPAEASKRIRLDFDDENNEENSDQSNQTDEYTASKSKIEKINEKKLAFIINNNLPFSIVDSEKFQELINTIRNSYFKLPLKNEKNTGEIYYLVRSFDDKGKSKDIRIEENEKNQVEEQNKIKEKTLIPLINRFKNFSDLG
ncbi:unnamed protein product [Brachionus calyciflorus]|uniref:BED-type domain-containing protein n=1 Tax=Brachionus calyciflorus TaxID=104777 RepID=A0A814CHG1_9BILA|nr:unnamed protein product [Brachionus calyciflorus]